MGFIVICVSISTIIITTTISIIMGFIIICVSISTSIIIITMILDRGAEELEAALLLLISLLQ